MSERFAGRTVLVTGGATGLGFVTVSSFLREGANVVVDALSDEQLAWAMPKLREISDHVVGVRADVRDTDQVQALIEQAVEQFGRLDVVVNNAGVFPSHLVLEMSKDDWDRVIETNLTGTFMVSQAAARVMIEQRSGVIVNTASATYESPRIGAAHYAASKAGVVALTKTLALELAPYGIRANVISPGLIEVINYQLPADPNPRNHDYEQAFLSGVPMGRQGMPEELTAGILFLASDDASYITGHVLSVDGGGTTGRFYLPRSRPATPTSG